MGADIGWRRTEVGRLVAGAGERGGDVYDGVGIDERLGYGYCVAGTVLRCQRVGTGRQTHLEGQPSL